MIGSQFPVPEVSAEDLKRFSQEFQILMAQSGPPTEGSGVGISTEILARVVSPGADMIALFMRSSLLIRVAESAGQLTDRIFDLAACYSIASLETFDAQEFLSRLKDG